MPARRLASPLLATLVSYAVLLIAGGILFESPHGVGPPHPLAVPVWLVLGGAIAGLLAAARTAEEAFLAAGLLAVLATLGWVGPLSSVPWATTVASYSLTWVVVGALSLRGALLVLRPSN